MNLSPNFTLAEMTVSQVAARLGLDNTPNKKQIAALTSLCVHVLEPVRAHYRRPVVVTSGFRAPLVNRAAKGSRNSQHCDGCASDFTVSGVPNIDVCRFIRDNLEFDQLIYEFGETGWVHCSWTPTGRRKEVRSAMRNAQGRIIYPLGLLKDGTHVR